MARDLMPLRALIRDAITLSDPHASSWREVLRDPRWTSEEIAESCATMAAHGEAALEALDRGDWSATLNELWRAGALEEQYTAAPCWSGLVPVASEALAVLRVDGRPVGYPGARLDALRLREGETWVSIKNTARMEAVEEVEAEALAARLAAGERWAVLEDPRAGAYRLATVAP
jgi:hypothetical protein